MPDESSNPFKAIARLLQAVRESLEGVKKPGQAPRWVRIVRVREFPADSDYIAKGVREAVNGFSTAIMYMSGLILDAKDLLIQSDAAKALVEVSAEFIKTATSDQFVNDLKAVVGQQGGGNPLSGVGGIVDTVVQIADKVPDPDDLKVIGQELYGLLCVELLPLDETGLRKTTEAHLDLVKTGKVRLLQWALDRSIAIQKLGKNKSSKEIARLGSRRVWQTGAEPLPDRATGLWREAGVTEGGEVVYQFNFIGDQQGRDIQEANEILTLLGYTEPVSTDTKLFDDALARRLRQFQVINGLTITGQLDNPTLNRLFNLDYDGKNLERAASYDPAGIPQGFDDSKNPPPKASD